MMTTTVHPIVESLYHRSDIPMRGLNRHVNPRMDPKYSKNLYKWLTYSKRVYTSIFVDKQDGCLYIGLRDAKMIWIGSKLATVACEGTKAETYSLTTKITSEWDEITQEFWTQYLGAGMYAFKNIWWNLD